jgi:carboxyl-terminal processing protease
MKSTEKHTKEKLDKLTKTLGGIEINKKEKKDNPVFKTKEVVFLLILTAIISLFMGGLFTYHISYKGEKVDNSLQEFITNYDYIVNNYYGKVDKSKLIDSAITGMLSSLDKNSTYVGSENSNFNIYLNGYYQGIGLQAYNDNNNNIVIYNVIKGSPASKAGFKMGDVLLKLNNEDVTNMTIADFSKLVKKQKGAFVLTYKRDSEEKKVKIKAEKIELKSVASKLIDKDSKKIGYIRVTIFANNTYGQFKKQLKNLEKQNIDGLVIDLRDNSGGHLSTATDIISLFLDSSHPIYQIKSKTEQTKYYSNGKTTKKYKIAILVNGNSASASEVTTSALKEQYGAFVVGEKTYGKGTVQQLQTLKDGEQYKLTTQTWLTSKGKTIDKIGIEPEYEVKLDEKYSGNPTLENDNQMQKALELLK